MSEHDIVTNLANGLSLLLSTGNYPEELGVRLRCLVEALTTFLRMYLSTAEGGERRVYLRLISQFIQARSGEFAHYPKVTHYLQFVQLITTQYLSATRALPAT